MESQGSSNSEAMAERLTERLPNYQLGEVLGKGAFGVVFKAINWTTGETVAVKQIGLANISRAELPEIMSEINLLKNLDHPNIVQYRGSSRTDESLFIVLEYCENGSLHGIYKRFGKFPEALVAQYIYQVLEGLLYLHDQGVIHRDIKGSNILATKEGSVKLADFGVATQTGLLKDSAVVGSPYWMAPEVIDQSGATPASDIWSVGAVVIELLEGRPPYADLDPMPALFRIVNDDFPPLPESASATALDFLMQCFQKDCNLRISARKLLKHPWMLLAKRHLEQTRREQLPRSPRPVSTYDENVEQVQRWNKSLAHTEQEPAHSQPLVKPRQNVAKALQKSDEKQVQAPLRIDPQGISDAATVKLAKPSTLAKDAAEDDVWDQDFEEGIPSSRIAALDTEDAEAMNEIDDKSVTIKPKKVLQPPATAQKSTLRPVAEDYSDIEVEDAKLKERVASLQLSQQAKKHILHPRDLSVGSSGSVKDLSRTIRGPPTSPFQPIKLRVKHRSDPSTGKKAVSGLARFVETDDESDDFSDLLQSPPSKHQAVYNLSPTPELQLNSSLSGRSSFGDEISDEDDPFAEVDFAELDTGVEDVQQKLARERISRMNAFVDHFIECLPNTNDVSDFEANQMCLKLTVFADECGQAEVQKAFLKDHGLLALLEALQWRKSREALASVLRLINSMVGNTTATLEKICLMGGCPAIMAFANNRFAREIRLEAALFIGLVCKTSLLTLQMFISCQGLKVLAGLVDESYKDQKDLIWIAIDGLLRVFEMQGSMPRNDFCRMLAHENLLPPLANALTSCSLDNDSLAQHVKLKIIQIFLLFAQSDLKVREALANRAVLSRLVKCLKTADGDQQLSLLKTIRNLSMSPKALDVLQNASVIEVLVDVLAKDLRKSTSTDIVNPVVNTLYNMCRLSKARQEEAASAGAIPVLMSLVEVNSPLKQFAVPILCDFAQNSKSCRRMMWQWNGLDFYLNLLKDPYWSTSALESISVWLNDETARVEDTLLNEAASEAVRDCFVRAKASAFENLLDPLLKIFRTSSGLANSIIPQQAFYSRLLDRVTSHSKPAVRLNLLRIVKTVYDHPKRSRNAKMGKDSDLARTISNLAKSDAALLVRQLAKEIQGLIGGDAKLPNIKRSSSTTSGLSLASKSSDLLTRLKKTSGDKLSRSSTSSNLKSRKT